MSIFQNKIKSKAMQIHKESVDSLEYVVDFPPRKKIGITFRRHNEWGIVKVVPEGSDIIVGSLLSAVNGKSVLLMKFDDAIAKAAEALTSGNAFTITFLAPYRLEGVMKKHETRRMGKGWKSYYFELNSGILQCFVKKQGRLKYEWDLANETQHQTLITLAPRNILNEGEMGIMIVKGGEKVLLKAEDNTRTQTWGAFIYLAIVIANGGNPDMYSLENKRIKEREPDAQVDMKALMAQAEAAEREALRKHAEAEKKAKAEAEKAAAEAARLKEQAEAADGEARAKAEEEARLAEEKALEMQAKEEEELAKLAKAQKSSRRASLVSQVINPEPEPEPVAATIPELEEEDDMDVLVMDEPEPEMPAPPTAEEEAEAARVAAEQEAAEKAEADRIAAEKAEQERLAAEKAEAEKAEAERLAAEKAEADRIAAEKAEQERLATEKAEAELAATLNEAEAAERAAKLAAEKEEADRIAAEKAEEERLAAEKAEAEKAEVERLAAEKAEADRIAAEKAEQERLAAEAEKAHAEALAQAEEVEEEVKKDLEHAEEAVLEEWADTLQEEAAAVELAAEEAAAAEFTGEDNIDLDAESEDEQEEAEYEAANADANMGFAYVDPSKHSHDDDDAAAEAAAAAALSRMGMSAEQEQQPQGDDKLKGFVKPRRSIFDKWQKGSDNLFNSAATKKKASSDADSYRPKLMKTKDAKSWMVQL